MSNTSNGSITALVPGGVVTTQNISTVIKPKENNNSMQFVKIQTPELSKKAVEQIRVAQESRITKDKIKEVEEEWQSNLLNWKSKRRQQLVGVHPAKTDHDQDEQNNNNDANNENGRKVKTFAEMIEQRAKTGNRLSFHLERYIGSSESDDQEEEELQEDEAPEEAYGLTVDGDKNENSNSDNNVKTNEANDNDRDQMTKDQDLNHDQDHSMCHKKPPTQVPTRKQPTTPQVLARAPPQILSASPQQLKQLQESSLSPIISSQQATPKAASTLPPPIEQPLSPQQTQQNPDNNNEQDHSRSPKVQPTQVPARKQPRTPQVLARAPPEILLANPQRHQVQISSLSPAISSRQVSPKVVSALPPPPPPQPVERPISSQHTQQHQLCQEPTVTFKQHSQQQTQAPARASPQVSSASPQQQPILESPLSPAVSSRQKSPKKAPALPPQIDQPSLLQRTQHKPHQPCQQPATDTPKQHTQQQTETPARFNPQVSSTSPQQQQLQESPLSPPVSSRQVTSKMAPKLPPPVDLPLSPQRTQQRLDSNKEQDYSRCHKIPPNQVPAREQRAAPPQVLTRAPPPILSPNPQRQQVHVSSQSPSISSRQASPKVAPKLPQPVERPLSPQRTQQKPHQLCQQQPTTVTPRQPQQQPQTPSTKEEKSQDGTVLSVSGKKRCSSCKEELGRGAAAFVIESLNLVYHTNCFRCSVCHVNLSNGFRGVDVRVHAGALHCQNCYSKDGLNYSRV